MDHLLKRIEALLKRKGMKPSRFGRRYFKDPRFVFDLRKGKRAVTPSTRRRILRIFRESVRKR